MALKQKIQEDLKIFLKEGKGEAVSVLRILNAAIVNKEKEKRLIFARKNPNAPEQELIEKSQLNDEEIIEVVFSEIKKRKEAILGFEKGKRQDLSEKEKKEKEMLEKYLPEQLSEEEVKKLAKEAIEKVSAKEQKDMGKVMAELIPKVRGKADGSLVSKIVKELLTLK